MLQTITRTLELTEWDCWLPDFPDNVSHKQAWGNLSEALIQKKMRKEGLGGLAIGNITHSTKTFKMSVDRFVELCEEAVK